ncbi:hypothetical protein N7495_001929 [Penicillium taxi]|uniref:uncharacterized protein n=1 Tax=Penicillium taxi TaxID=168475 RepID=UPI00254599E4|nr:uncharacterized protein N7495_001929 [Penicillium taxi]KAJ5909247.1 hypothetical protein N7495_001929 [Penicillium taxi]
MAAAQARQAVQANKHRREEDFGIGDMVWLSMKDYTTNRPNPTPGQEDQDAEPVVITGQLYSDEPEWEVEEILTSRLHYGKVQYKAKWEGTMQDMENWYPASNFKGCPALLEDFHERHPTFATPRGIKKWMTAWHDGFELEDDPADDKPEAPVSGRNRTNKGGNVTDTTGQAKGRKSSIG